MGWLGPRHIDETWGGIHAIESHYGDYGGDDVRECWSNAPFGLVAAKKKDAPIHLYAATAHRQHFADLYRPSRVLGLADRAD